MTEPTTPPSRHLDFLDAARGIAAIMVMVYHFLNWQHSNELQAKLASIVFNGSDAVSFFFVLSGFVLSYQYIVLDQPLDVRKFYINRLFRLLPAYLLIIFIIELYLNRTDLSLRQMISVFILNKTYFWEEAYLLRARSNLYGPGWTLAIELSLSFFIPFMVVLAKKGTSLICWLLLAYLLVINSAFFFHFALGVLLSCIFNRVRDASFRQTKWYRYRYFIIFAAICLFSIRHIDRISHMGSTYNYLSDYFQIGFFHYTGIASFIFIAALLISARAQKILAHKTLRFTGKISYGIYLTHWLTVWYFFDNWSKFSSVFSNSKEAFVILFLVYVAATIVQATLLHYLIELPFIRMGKRLTKRMKSSFVIN